MTTSQQEPTHRRSATRAPVGRPIKLQFDDSMDVIEGLCRNVSIGGMFIVFDSSRPAGSLVRFELELDNDDAIRGLGEVVWMRSKGEYGGPEAGFGLKFRFLEQRDRQMIFKLVSSHIKDRLAQREPAGGEPMDVSRAPSAGLAAPAAEALRATIAVPPEPEPAAGVEPPPVVAASAEPEPPRTVAEPPASLFAPPESDLLPLEPEAPAPETPELDLSPTQAPETDFAQDPFQLETEPESDHGAASETPVEGFQDDELPAFEEWPPDDAVPPDDELLSDDLLSGLSFPEPGGATFDPSERAPLAEAPADERPGRGLLEAIDLDPSVGETPLYELGLDPEPASPWPPAPEPASSAPPPTALSDNSYLAEDSADEEAGEPPAGGFAGSAPGRERRELSILPVIGVLLVAAVAVGYLFKDEILARFGAGPPAVESSAGPVAAPAPTAGTAEPGGDVSAGSPVATPAPAETQTPPAASTAPPPASPAPPPPVRAEATPPPPSVSTQPPPAAPARVAATQPAPPAAGAQASGDFSRLLDITWSEVSGGLQVTLTADGPVPTGRYRYFHLGGDAPREVVKLMGVSRSFRQSQLTVGGPGVRRIRTGFHRVNGGNEQHVVIDLLGPRWKITDVRSVGSRLELTITEE